MYQSTKIHLNTSAILDIPINSYDKDFTFIVNGEEFQTTKIISDLLSSKISQMHSIDPTFDSYTISTQNHGNFSHFLQLVNFSEKALPNDELPFFREILDNLQSGHISIQLPLREEELTITNVIGYIKHHEQDKRLYSEYLREDIEFICQHFSELSEKQEEELKDISIDTLELILEQEELQLRDENQLLNILNELYQKDSKYSILYKYVYFSIVDVECICEFIDLFEIGDLDQEIWLQISKRLKEKVEITENFARPSGHHKNREATHSNMKEFICNHDDKFEGIINFLNKESNGDIKNLIQITPSSNLTNDSPYNVFLYEEKDRGSFFVTANEPNSWICFDFKDHKVIPTNYLIKTVYSKNSYNPKSWILECSNDDVNWEKLDEQREFPHLNDQYVVHTFDIQTQIQDPVRYIRIKQTGPTWNKCHNLGFSCVEFYGKLL